MWSFICILVSSKVLINCLEACENSGWVNNVSLAFYFSPLRAVRDVPLYGYLCGYQFCHAFLVKSSIFPWNRHYKIKHHSIIGVKNIYFSLLIRSDPWFYNVVIHQTHHQWNRHSKIFQISCLDVIIICYHHFVSKIIVSSTVIIATLISSGIPKQRLRDSTWKFLYHWWSSTKLCVVSSIHLFTPFEFFCASTLHCKQFTVFPLYQFWE